MFSLKVSCPIPCTLHHLNPLIFKGTVQWFFFVCFTISLDLVNIFMYTQWFYKFGLWNVHKSRSSCWYAGILLVFRATRKLMLWYLEQLVISCYRMRKSMLKVIRATTKSMPQFSGPISRIWAKFPDQTLTKNATLKNALIWSLLKNKNISCHSIYKRPLALSQEL